MFGMSQRKARKEQALADYQARCAQAETQVMAKLSSYASQSARIKAASGVALLISEGHDWLYVRDVMGLAAHLGTK